MMLIRKPRPKFQARPRHLRTLLRVEHLPHRVGQCFNVAWVIQHIPVQAVGHDLGRAVEPGADDRQSHRQCFEHDQTARVVPRGQDEEVGCLVKSRHLLCRHARQLGIVTLVDAAQSAGHCPLDVQEIGCDFLAFSSHKICGPTGLGVLYGRREILENLPPYQGGGEMISKVEYHHTTYNVPPHRFEAGTPHISGAVGLHAAVDYLDAVGRDRIFAHDQELANYAEQRLQEFEGIRIFGPKQGRAGLVSFVLPNAHALDVATLVDQRGVALRAGHHCNQPLMGKLGVPATLRASFYFYNNREEIDRFIEILQWTVKLFSR